MPKHNNIVNRREFMTAAGIGTASALAGCSTSVLSQPASTVPTLSAAGWGQGVEREIVERILRNYDQSHDSVQVTYQSVPGDYAQQMKTEYAGGTEPDVFYLAAERAAPFLRNEALMNLNPYIQDDPQYDFDDLIDNLLSAFQYQGKTYGIPKDYTPVGLYYNEAHLRQAGAKTSLETWDDMRSAFEQVKRNTDVTYPLGILSQPRETLFPLIWQTGASVLNDDGTECVVGSPGAIEALQFLVDLYDDGLAGIYSSEVSVGWGAPALGEGLITASMGGAWFVSALREEYADSVEALRVAERMPVPKGGRQATMLLTTAWAPSSNPTDEQAAAGLVKALTDKQGMWQWAKTGTALPARESLLNRPFYQDRPLLDNLVKLTESGLPLQFGLNSTRIVNTILSEAEGAITGDRSADSAMKSAERLINNNILE